MRWLQNLSRNFRARRQLVQSQTSRRRMLFENLEPRQMLTSVPVALADPLYSTAVNTDLTISAAASGVLNNDFDADGNSLTASVVANPSNGSLVSFSTNGTFTYRPNTSFTGIDSFTYKANDGTNDSNVVTVTVAVGGNFGVRTNQDDLPQNGMLMTGGLTLAQPLTLGHQLVYRSDTVNPQPVVVVETSLLSTSSVPDSIDAQLTFGGVSGSTVSYDTTGLSAGDALRFALQVDGSSLSTGWHDYTLTLTAHFGGTSYSRAYTGSQAVVNRSSSEFGKGWWLDGLDQLVISGSNALLVKGNGDALYFKGDGSGGYLKADGDTSESTLVKNVDNTYTLTSKFGLKHNFGTTGLLTSVVDTNSNTIGYTYSSGKLSQIDDPFSRDTTFSYTSGYLTSFSDHASRTTTLTQTSGKLTMVTHPDPDGGGALAAPETDYAYDGTTALMTSTNDPMNFTTSFSYNSDTKRLSGITYPVGTFTLTPQQTMGFATGSGNSLYDPADAVAQYVDGRGKTWKFKTDRFGNVIYFKDPLNNVTTTERDHDGRPIRLTQADPDGGGALAAPVTKFGYNSSGDQVKQYQPDGNVQTWTYHTTWHQPLTFVNELNKTWTFTYDATKGNLLSEQDPLGNTTTYTYTLIGRVADITTPDPDGGGALSASVTDFDYDTYGRLDEITNPGGSTKTFTYTTADLLDTTTDELSHVWDRNYDNLSRLTSETSPDPDGAGSLTAATTSYTYNASSWLTKITDALGNDTDYTYNNRGWVTQIERPDPDGAGSLGRPTSTYTRDGEGNVTQEGQYNVLLQNITYAYNDAGWRTNRLGPVMSTTGTWWTYDNLGRVTKEARGSSTTDYSYVKYAYNSRGWVTSTTESVPGFMSTVDGTPKTYTYDSAGQLTSVTDQRGYTTAYTYNDAGWQTKVTLPDPDSSTGGLVSPVIQFGYDNIGRMTTQTDPLGRVTTTAYDSRHRVTKVTQPDPDAGGGLVAPETEYAYNNANLVTSVTDPLDRVTSYTYDNSNRLLTITLPDPDGGGGLASPVTTYAYNKMNSVTSVTDPLGNVTSTTYDNLQRQTQVTQPDPDGGGGLSAPVTSFTYNAQALLSKITDPLSRDTTFGYDNFGRRTTVTNHEGKVTTTAYDDYNRVTSVTTPDPDGAGSQTTSATSYLYDLQDRVTRITDARSYQTNFTYDAVGNLTNLQDGLSNDTTWTYDGINRVTQENNELSSSRYFVYDAASNLIRRTDRNGRVTRYTYDDLDRLTSELWIDSGSPTPTVTGATTTQGGATNEVQRVGFDGGAFSLTGGTFTLTFDGQTTSAIAYNASAATVKSALEALSNIDPDEVAVTKITDTTFKQEWRLTFQNDLGGTNVAQTTVDASNVQAGMMPPMTEIEATDTPGATNSEVQTVTIGNSPTAGTFRLTFGTEQTADIAYNASASTVDSALEALSGIDTVTVSGSAGGPYTITFTGSHANTNVAQITGDATYLTKGTVDRTISFAYDVASQLASTSDTDSSYAYTYDNLGRVLTTSNSGTSGVPTVVLTSAYNANGQRTSLSATKGGTNDFLNTYTYDNLSRLTRVDQTGNGGATVADKRVNFAYNAVGQFTSIDRNYKLSGTWTEVATSTFTYDTLHRLTALDHKKGATDIANYDFTYDHMNRMTQFSGPDGTSDFTYDKESQVTATDHSYQTDESNTYDATGNRTNGSYTVASNNRMSSDGTYNYTYDSEGNRSTRTKISDSSITEYTWDHRNRLTKVVERATGAGGAITKQADYKYDVFDRRINKSADADGAGAGAAVVSRYVYFGDNIVLQFDGSNALTHRYLHGPAVDQILADEDGSNAILWALGDHQGTIRDIVNNSGTVQNHIKYGTFGNVTAETNAAIDLIYGYTGRERDEETGLMYYRARYYDPAVGRFLSHDPIGFAGGDPNLSRYVTNNTPNMVDSYGFEGADATITQLDPNLAAIRDYIVEQGIKTMTIDELLNSSPRPVPAVTEVPGLLGSTYHLNDTYFAGNALGTPCVVCHGVCAQGIVGPPNSFRFPSGPGTLQYGNDLRDTTAVVTWVFGSGMAGAVVIPTLGVPAAAGGAAATGAGTVGGTAVGTAGTGGTVGGSVAAAGTTTTATATAPIMPTGVTIGPAGTITAHSIPYTIQLARLEALLVTARESYRILLDSGLLDRAAQAYADIQRLERAIEYLKHATGQ